MSLGYEKFSDRSDGDERYHDIVSALEKSGRKSEQADESTKRNQADRLIQYALYSGAELFVDHLGEPHALVTGTQAVALNSRAYPWLRRMMWDKEQKTITGEALKTAAETLGAFALASENVRTLYTRSAFHDGKVYYWLGPERVVEIDSEGWRVREGAPVLFRTIPNLRELPDPSADGSWSGLAALVNLKGERDKRLFRAYLVTLPLEHIPRTIFQPTGVMGSGKSAVCRTIKRLLDPAAPESVRIDPRDFLQKASHSYVVMLDNQNSLPEWAVDTLCRLVTGEADSKRRHYTNDEDFIYELKRAILLNGINAPTDRGDAQDRTLPVELDRIPDHVRRDEEALWALFESEQPRILGALFDALSDTLRTRARVKLSKRPRLADWGYYAAAVYESQGWGTERFIEDWEGVVRSQNQETLDGSPLAQCILAIMEVHDEFRARPDKLLEALEAEAEKLKINTKRDKKWPGSTSWVYRRIKEVIPLLAARGITVPPPKETKAGNEIVLLKGGGISPDDPSASTTVSTSASTTDSAEECGGDEMDAKGGSSGSKYGDKNTSLTPKVEDGVEPLDDPESDTPRRLPRNASTASTDVTPAMGYEPPDRDYNTLDYDPDDDPYVYGPSPIRPSAPLPR